MSNTPHVLVYAGGFHAKPFGVALVAVAVCAFLVGFALSLHGRAPEGVIVGIGTTFASMLATAQPARWPGPLGLDVATAIACWAVMARARPIGGVPRRLRDAVMAPLRSGGLWMAVPLAVAVLVTSGRFLGLIGTVVVLVVVGAAARGRGRDVSVGYVAGLLVCLAALVASAYGQHAGAGAVLVYPSGLTGLIGLGCAARIGLDPAFKPWQRVAAIGVGAATLIATASTGVFLAAAVGCMTYLVCCLRTRSTAEPSRRPRTHRPADAPGRDFGARYFAAGYFGMGYFGPLRWGSGIGDLAWMNHPDRLGGADRPDGHAQAEADWRAAHSAAVARGFAKAAGAAAPLVALAVLWVVTYASTPHPARGARVSAPSDSYLFMLRSASVASVMAGWLAIVAMLIGGALIAWRVTGPGLPIWVTVVGLTGVAAVLSGPAATPSPGWVLALGAELWVLCHGLRTTRQVIPSPRTVAKS